MMRQDGVVTDCGEDMGHTEQETGARRNRPSKTLVIVVLAIVAVVVIATYAYMSRPMYDSFDDMQRQTSGMYMHEGVVTDYVRVVGSRIEHTTKENPEVVDVHAVASYDEKNGTMRTDAGYVSFDSDGNLTFDGKVYKRGGAWPKPTDTRRDASANEGDEPNTSESTSARRDDMTKSQKNALLKALSYLDTMPFSARGLVEQLEYEGFSNDDAMFAVSHCNANWNEQAALKANSYLEVMPFSHSRLVEQLVHDGFTQEQAEYGVSTTGL